jgi:hypothetical protein
MKTFTRLAIVALAMSCPAGLAVVASAVAVCFVGDLICDVAWFVSEVRSAR